jgi:hypothetical protein
VVFGIIVDTFSEVLAAGIFCCLFGIIRTNYFYFAKKNLVARREVQDPGSYGERVLHLQVGCYIGVPLVSLMAHHSLKTHEFERLGNGFKTHVTKEHHMWCVSRFLFFFCFYCSTIFSPSIIGRNYLFFMLHLNAKKTTDYTSHEQYFVKMLKDNKEGDLFPINKALALANTGDTSVEKKLEQLTETLQGIRALLEAQATREIERERNAATRAWRARVDRE